MTRFLSQQVVKSGGKNITVMTRPAEDLNSFATRAPKVVLEARQRLQHAYAKLGYQTDAVKKAAHRYFLTDSLYIAKTDLEYIKRVYVLTIDGLAGDVTIKTGATVGSGNDDSNGEVNASPNLNLVKPYHNLVVDRDDGQMSKWGAIKVDGARLLSALGVKTFIHEATHKYAGTTDYCYFNDDGVTPRSTFDDKAKALDNADSYAWFAYTVGATIN